MDWLRYIKSLVVESCYIESERLRIGVNALAQFLSVAGDYYLRRQSEGGYGSK